MPSPPPAPVTKACSEQSSLAEARPVSHRKRTNKTFTRLRVDNIDSSSQVNDLCRGIFVVTGHRLNAVRADERPDRHEPSGGSLDWHRARGSAFPPHCYWRPHGRPLHRPPRLTRSGRGSFGNLDKGRLPGCTRYPRPADRSKAALRVIRTSNNWRGISLSSGVSNRELGYGILEPSRTLAKSLLAFISPYDACWLSVLDDFRLFVPRA